LTPVWHENADLMTARRLTSSIALAARLQGNDPRRTGGTFST